MNWIILLAVVIIFGLIAFFLYKKIDKNDPMNIPDNKPIETNAINKELKHNIQQYERDHPYTPLNRKSTFLKSTGFIPKSNDHIN